LIWPCNCLSGCHPGESAWGKSKFWGSNLIVRVLQGRVLPAQTANFHKQAEKALKDARRQDGLVSAHAGRQAHADGSEEIAFVTIWRDLEALYGWLGGTDLLDAPGFNHTSPSVFAHFEIQHYETFEGGDDGLQGAIESTPVATLNA
jgi:heme-degrading monooxygenase HmoA